MKYKKTRLEGVALWLLPERDAQQIEGI